MPGVVLNQWLSKCDSQTSDFSITQELVRYAHSHIPALVNCVRSSGGAQRWRLTSPPGDSSAHVHFRILGTLNALTQPNFFETQGGRYLYYHHFTDGELRHKKVK